MTVDLALLPGLIWMAALGLAAGNMATTIIHRLPRGLSLFTYNPVCGVCRAPLSTGDLFPVFSRLLLKGRCRYCGVPIPSSHLWTELASALLFCLVYLQHGFSEPMLLLCGLGIFLIMLAAIEYNEQIIERRILLGVLIFAMLYRTLQDGSIYPFLGGGFAMLMLGGALWRLRIPKATLLWPLPDAVALLTVAGVALTDRYGFVQLMAALGVGMILYLPLGWVYKCRRPEEKAPITMVYAPVLLLPLLFPEWLAILMRVLALR